MVITVENAPIGSIAPAIGGRVKDRIDLVFNMTEDVKSARTTKQLLDVRPEFFDYIPPEIKRRMGVQDDG